MIRWLLVALLPGLILMPGADPAAASQSSELEKIAGVLTGKVSSDSGTGLAGVQIKIFEEGFLVNDTETGSDGSYRLEFSYLPDIDWTILVWFVLPGSDLIPEIMILRESLKSKDMELWSPCLPRIHLNARMRHDVTLLTEAAKLAQISELDCLAGQGN
ncbi:MAG: carboxypeptidase regulatory-like domain-containing protein [Candidatus Eisenbacteria sp.]|nr:carboxypeptidase regulatory-like domain-containing protein [Candidatus Eisenbacteria bacterium]